MKQLFLYVNLSRRLKTDYFKLKYLKIQQMFHCLPAIKRKIDRSHFLAVPIVRSVCHLLAAKETEILKVLITVHKEGLKQAIFAN